jgi:hypothetical protein
MPIRVRISKTSNLPKWFPKIFTDPEVG